MKQNSQLKFWISANGDNYIKRNLESSEKIEAGVKAYKKIFNNIDVSSALEIGSNIGSNLLIISKIFKGKIDLYAVEPNRKALAYSTARRDIKLSGSWRTDASNIPLGDNSMDLVFTSGVLIHIAPQNLLRATEEIVRVSKHYILCIEYFSHQPVEIPYRGRKGFLFKRDFGSFYLDNFPNLRIVDYGFFWQRDLPIFDNLNWWLLEKKLGK